MVTNKIVDLIYKIATGDLKTRIILTPIAATLFLALLAGFILIALATDHVLALPTYLPLWLSAMLGIPLLVCGFALMLMTIICFIREKGTPVPLNPPPKLIQYGPYRYVRNPMLIGVFLLLFGIGFYFRSFSLVCIFTPLFILLNYFELKYIEEPELTKRFGNQYQEYKNRTGRFWPKRVPGTDSLKKLV